MSHALITSAARAEPRTTVRGQLEATFARLFTSFVYPQIWEDPVVDMEALRIGPDTRMVAIASGGCNVMSYLTAQPKRLIAVDLNPAHLALLELKLVAARHLESHADFFGLFGNAKDGINVRLFDQRLAERLSPESRDFWQSRTLSGRRRIDFLRTGLYRQGLLGRSISAAHLLCRLLGCRLDRLVAADSHQALKQAFADEVGPVLESRLVGLLFRFPTTLFGLGIPPRQYDALMAEDPAHPVKVVRQRVERLLTAFPLDQNYFAHQALTHTYGSSLPPYLEAQAFETIKAGVPTVERRHDTITNVLARESDASLDGFVLLDAQDWMDGDQLRELWEAITRTAAPGGRFIFRSAGRLPPSFNALPEGLSNRWRRLDELSEHLHCRDRSGIYGAMHVFEKQG